MRCLVCDNPTHSMHSLCCNCIKRLDPSGKNERCYLAVTFEISKLRKKIQYEREGKLNVHKNNL